MKSIQKMEAGKYYLIESKASANSVYFETDALAKLFFRYCNYYLKDYLYVEEYALNEHGWTMLIKVKSVQTIRKHYFLMESERKSHPKESKSIGAKDIWWILSERVRLFISTYVRMSNKILGREGSLVRRKYGRYQFSNLEEARDYVSTIRNNKHDLGQSKETYRGKEEHFRMHGNVLTNPFKSSLWIELCGDREDVQGRIPEIFGDEMPIIKGLGNLVVPKFKMDVTAMINHPPNPPNP